MNCRLCYVVYLITKTHSPDKPHAVQGRRGVTQRQSPDQMTLQHNKITNIMKEMSCTQGTLCPSRTERNVWSIAMHNNGVRGAARLQLSDMLYRVITEYVLTLPSVMAKKSGTIRHPHIQALKLHWMRSDDRCITSTSVDTAWCCNVSLEVLLVVATICAHPVYIKSEL